MPKIDEALKARSRALRTNQSPIEARLWAALRAHRFNGAKFARQVVVEPYILDSAARTAKRSKSTGIHMAPGASMMRAGPRSSNSGAIA